MTEMTYSQSARGVMISMRRAVKELHDHGIDNVPAALIEFAEEYNLNTDDLAPTSAWCDAGDLLDWLGY